MKRNNKNFVVSYTNSEYDNDVLPTTNTITVDFDRFVIVV